MSRKIDLNCSELMNAVMAADDDERMQQGICMMYEDLFSLGYRVRIDFNDDTKEFRLHGDIISKWISVDDLREIMTAMLYDLPYLMTIIPDYDLEWTDKMEEEFKEIRGDYLC